jgi:hypothetical protein
MGHTCLGVYGRMCVRKGAKEVMALAHHLMVVIYSSAESG